MLEDTESLEVTSNTSNQNEWLDRKEYHPTLESNEQVCKIVSNLPLVEKSAKMKRN